MIRTIKGAVLATACLCLLAACKGSDNAPPAERSAKDIQAVVDAGAFSEELDEVDGDTAFALYRLADYGLSREDLTDCAVLRSSGATCEEAALLIMSDDSEKIAQAEQALKDYVADQIEENKDYRPAEIPKLESALIDRRGASLLLIVAEDMKSAEKALKES